MPVPLGSTRDAACCVWLYIGIVHSLYILPTAWLPLAAIVAD